MPDRLNKNHILPWLMLAAVLVTVAFIAFGTESESVWECSPVDPFATEVPGCVPWHVTRSYYHKESKHVTLQEVQEVRLAMQCLAAVPDPTAYTAAVACN